MDILKDRIVKDGVAIGTEILKVDSFLNHQIDVVLLDQIGAEFKRLFADCGVTKILTIEASGIPIACFAAVHFGNVPVVFAKKAAPNTMTEEFYGAEVKSFTKGTVSVARISKKYLTEEDNVLIVDDFLAHGEAAWGLASLVEQVGAKLAGVGAVIEKQFQGGGRKLAEAGVRVESLAVIKSIKDGNIEFA